MGAFDWALWTVQIIFIIFKLTNVISWSWITVLIPFWIWLTILFIGLFIIILFLLIAAVAV